MLNINKTKKENGYVISLEGRLDTNTAPTLEGEIKAVLDGISYLEFDLDNLEYISSAGLRVLLFAQKSMSKQGEMKVTHVKETIMEIFDVTGFADILSIEA